jgi:penicillin amidase
MNTPSIFNSDRSERLFKKARWLAPVALLAAGVAGFNYALRRFLRRPLPQKSGHLAVVGLRQPVKVIHDRWGVPHIYAHNEHDLFFAQGFVQAQDRLFQMDVSRRVGAGRLSEVVGPSGLASDRFARMCGWPRAASAQVAGGDPETLDLAEAFAAGVNAFINQGKLPIEFSLLAYKPDPWRVLDSAAWGTVLAWGLSVNWETELMRAALIETLGPQKAADLTPTYDHDYTTILPETQIGARLAEALVEAYHQAASHLPLGSVPVGHGVGSNNWVVNGQRTASGRPILANDPHLPPFFPPFWYENHLVGGRYNVAGFTMPGIPGVVIGHNEHVAWGVTNAFPDIQDVYVERLHPQEPDLYEIAGKWKAMEIVSETIKVRGHRPTVEKVRYTDHGPIISDLIPEEHRTLALRWVSHEPNNHLRAILETNRAYDWDTFRHGLRHWGFPSQNVVYADVEGNIGYIMPGMIPIRSKGKGLVPVPGWNRDYEWTGWIPFSDLPARYNPPQGVIATANNQVVGSGYPYLLTGEWLPDYRVKRILELVDELTPLSLADNARIQTDTVSLLARRFLFLALPLLVSHEPDHDSMYGRALHLLQAWDHDMRADSVAATLFFGLLVNFTQAVIEQAVGPDLAQQLLGQSLDQFADHPFHEIGYELAIRWLEQGPPDWVGDVGSLLMPAFRQTICTLQKGFGYDSNSWQWGRLHQLHLHNHLARIPGLGRLWKPMTLPVAGDGYSVNQTDLSPQFPPHPVNIIPSCRLIMDVGQWDNSLAVLPGGQSGHPASYHYQDGVDDWQHGRYHPMLFSYHRVQRAARATLSLHP